MKLAGCMCFTAVLACAQNPGITPRPGAADYPASKTLGGMTVAAALVPADQARKIFGENIDRAGYVVFEVAVYPEKDRRPEVTPADFMLRMGPAGGTMRPSEPNVVAASTIPYDKQHHQTAPPPSLPGDVHVYTESTIGYESGPYRRGVYTGGGVVVTNYPPPPPPPPPPGAPPKDQRRYELEMALAAKALPAGQITQPVAGYLYFPKPPARHKGEPYDLALYLPGEPAAHLMLKPAN